MTPIEDRVRAAIRDTARQIPPGPPPPLALPQPRRRWSRRPGWRAWALPVGAAALVAVLVAALGLIPFPWTGSQPRNAAPSAPPTRSQVRAVSLPAYYVALTSADGEPPGIVPQATTATIRATATGKVLATIAVPRPYYAFTSVTATPDGHTFVLVAEESKAADTHVPGVLNAAAPLARFYVLHLGPASPIASGPAPLRALPASSIPAGDTVQSMALSADGTSLAASIGTLFASKLYVFGLATGHQRVWSWSRCPGCSTNSIGSQGPGLLSWTGDGRQVAFVFMGAGASEGQVRLLDTGAPGTSLVADSRAIITAPDGSDTYWRQMVVTPDGQTILAVRELAANGQPVRQQLVRYSVATGQLTAIGNQPPIGPSYEQIQWTSTSGRELVISGAQHGGGAEVLTGARATPIPWSSHIFAAAW
jgi:hypothetical protein